MNESQFLSKLEDALQNDLPSNVVREQLTYYKGYIDSEKASGKTESEVVEALGDPWVIARNIIEMNEVVVEAEEVKRSTTRQEKTEEQKNFQVRYMQSRIGCLISALIVVMLIFFFSSVALRLLLAVWPVILIFVLGGALYRFFTKR